MFKICIIIAALPSNIDDILVFCKIQEKFLYHSHPRLKVKEIYSSRCSRIIIWHSSFIYIYKQI